MTINDKQAVLFRYNGITYIYAFNPDVGKYGVAVYEGDFLHFLDPKTLPTEVFKQWL